MRLAIAVPVGEQLKERLAFDLNELNMNDAMGTLRASSLLSRSNAGTHMEVDTTEWFPLDRYAPYRDGWYEVRLTSGDTAFSRYVEGHWTEQPVLMFTHWRGLSADPGIAADTEHMDAQAAAAQGVRAVWNAFFPGVQDTQPAKE